VNCIFI